VQASLCRYDKRRKAPKRYDRKCLLFTPAEEQRFAVRSMVEPVNARLKDEFGARIVRVRGASKVGEQALCAMFLDGTCFHQQQVIVALGLTLQGQKVVLGLRQGATENRKVVQQLLEDLQRRGVDFEVPRL
jgi:hypothetical protein